MDLLFASCLMLRPVLLAAAVAALLWNRRWHGAEAACCGIVLSLALLSTLYQGAFLLGVPGWTEPLEILTLAGAGLWVLSERRRLAGRTLPVLPVRWPGRVAAAATLAYLLAQAWLLPPGNWDSMTYNLARVLLAQDAGTLFLTDVNTPRQAVFPYGADILAHLLLRFHLDYGLGLFSWLSYIAIGLGTYAAARRFALRRDAVLAAWVVCSAPLLIYQATSTKNDIVAAGAAAGALVAGLRWQARPAAREFLVFVSCLVWGLSAKTTFGPLAVIMAPALIVSAARRHGWAEVGRALRRAAPALVALTPAWFVGSQAWLYVHNVRTWGGFQGPPEFSIPFSNRDGWTGMAANLGRYAVVSVDFLEPLDRWMERASGRRLSERLVAASGLGAGQPLEKIGMRQGEVFSNRWVADENHSWFGPLACLLIIPSALWSLCVRKARILAWSCVGFTLIVAASVAYMKNNGRFFAIPLALTGPCVALALRRLNGGPMARFGLAFLCLSIAVYASAANRMKPACGSRSIWKESDFGANRMLYYDWRFKDQRVWRVGARLPRGARVGLALGENSWLFPYLVKIRHVTWINLPTANSQYGIDDIVRDLSARRLTHLLIQDHLALDDPAIRQWALRVLLERREGEHPFALLQLRHDSSGPPPDL